MKNQAERAFSIDVTHKARATHNDPVCGRELGCGGTCALVEDHDGKCLCPGDKKDTPGTCKG